MRIWSAVPRNELSALEIHSAQGTGVLERELRRCDRNRHTHCHRPGLHELPLRVNDHCGATVAMIGNSFCQHLHAIKRYQGRRRADHKSLTVSLSVRS